MYKNPRQDQIHSTNYPPGSLSGYAPSSVSSLNMNGFQGGQYDHPQGEKSGQGKYYQHREVSPKKKKVESGKHNAPSSPLGAFHKTDPSRQDPHKTPDKHSVDLKSADNIIRRPPAQRQLNFDEFEEDHSVPTWNQQQYRSHNQPTHPAPPTHPTHSHQGHPGYPSHSGYPSHTAYSSHPYSSQQYPTHPSSTPSQHHPVQQSSLSQLHPPSHSSSSVPSYASQPHPSSSQTPSYASQGHPPSLHQSQPIPASYQTVSSHQAPLHQSQPIPQVHQPSRHHPSHHSEHHPSHHTEKDITTNKDELLSSQHVNFSSSTSDLGNPYTSNAAGPYAANGPTMMGMHQDGSRLVPDMQHSGSSQQSQETKGNPDPYALLGLLKILKMTNPDLNTLASGTDLTTLGLNLSSTDVLYSNFSSPFSSTPLKREPEYYIPPSYQLPSLTLPTDKMSMYKDETLFYIFYSMPKDTLQMAAAAELACRDWSYHKELKVWFQRSPGTPLLKTINYETGTYIYFDEQEWKNKIKHNFQMDYDKLYSMKS